MKENTDPSAPKIDITKEEHRLVNSFDQFQKQKDRFYKGFKEATWNNKYMQLIKKYLFLLNIV